MSGSPSAICAKARFPHLSEASKFSFFIAQVPSCPEAFFDDFDFRIGPFKTFGTIGTF